ncbi:GbsR/MarR family transcriptional regulator [Aestuariibius insulae]|uniref:GbsR/MarR family transcriptional regulator n=1 Tax=Aestuariibius insulae TaxID=2058287 RepID=UPI00345EC34D
MHLTPAMKDFILHWGEMGAKWGTNRSVAQIHALLHIAPEPLTAEEISEVLSLARSNVSTGLKELQGWNLVEGKREIGERRDRFHSVRDMFELVTRVIEERRAREFAPTLAALQRVREEAEQDATPQDVKERIDETLQTMELFDGWYQDVSKLPRRVQMAALNLGGRIARLLPK